MPVIVVAGEPGSGKTSQCLAVGKIAGPTAWAVLEIKDVRVLQKFADENINWVAINATYPAGTLDDFGEDCSFMVDPVVTLQHLEQWIKDLVLAPTPKVKTIVVDGISDIRDYATSEWLINDNAIRRKNQKPPRKSIGGENKFAWSEINDRVRRLIEPLMNWTMHNHLNLILTAQMKDRYLNDTRVGSEVDVKAWLMYPAETILVLGHEKEHYWLQRVKVPHWTQFPAEADLPRETGLYELLAKEALIE